MDKLRGLGLFAWGCGLRQDPRAEPSQREDQPYPPSPVTLEASSEAPLAAAPPVAGWGLATELTGLKISLLQLVQVRICSAPRVGQRKPARLQRSCPKSARSAKRKNAAMLHEESGSTTATHRPFKV